MAIKKKKTAAKKAKKAKPTLVWKRAKRGRPKKQASAAGRRAPRKPKKNLLVKKLPMANGQQLATKNNGHELRIEESKFQLGPKQNAGEFQAHNLPLDYGHNRIILLVVGPKFAFVYWEVQPDKMHEAVKRLGKGAKLTLRFTNTDNGHTWDTSVYERVGNWYVKLEQPGQNLTVTIGMKNDAGVFYSIAVSNTMRLPRLGLAKPGPIKWMIVSPSGEKVITEVEEYTDADLELLKKILGPYFYDLMRKGKFGGIAGSSAENIFMNIEESSSSFL